MSINTKKSNKKLAISDLLLSSPLTRLETEILIAFLIKKSREFILTHPETIITPALYRTFQKLATKRQADWPIAYLIGHKEFYDLDLAVSPATLVPRPETEMIVEEIISIIKNSAGRKSTNDHRWIIDLGTGSGAIIIAIAHELRRLFPLDYQTIDLAAIDISAQALQIARLNAKQYKLSGKIKFYQGDLLNPLPLRGPKASQSNLLIAANLPYLTPKQIKTSPSIRREPRLALVGGPDGLKYYRQLFQQLTKTAFRSATVFCEIDPGQSKKISALAAKYFPNAPYNLQTDFCGQTRLFIIKITR